MTNEWTLVSDKFPPLNTDILIYSATLNGYAVAITEAFGNQRQWKNSTNGAPFAPNTVTHWMPLPAPPSAGIFQSYSNLKAVN